MRNLSAVLAEPRVAAVVVTSLIARLPKGMLPLAMVLLLRQRTGSYAVAGLTVGLVAIGDAATTPLQGRLVDRYGRGRVLLPTAAVHVLAVTAVLLLAGSAASTGWLAVAATVAGVGVPPISGCVKAIWAELVAAPVFLRRTPWNRCCNRCSSCPGRSW